MTTTFGRDVSCTDAMRTGRFASGLRLVAEAAYRRLTTPRGMLLGGEDEANYGLDLSELVGCGEAEAASLPGRIGNELKKDVRIEAVSVDVARETATDGSVTLTVTVEADTAEGPFTLQVRADAVSVELLGITFPEAA